jgi:hypothetical protein
LRISDFGLRIAYLTAKSAKNAKKEYLYVLFVFFVVKELFVGLRFAGRRTGASAFAVPMADSRLRTLPWPLGVKPAFCNTGERWLFGLNMMRNAGDFANAVDMYPEFQRDAKQLARQLSLPATSDAFSLSEIMLEREYFDRFEAICNELRNAESGPASNGGAVTPTGNSY